MGSEIKLVIKKKEIEDFLRHSFKCRKGPIRINRTCDIGRMIYSMVRTSTLPIKQTFLPDENVICLILPDHPTATDGWKYVHFTKEDMVRINDFLLASFNIFFQTYMLVGDGMKIDQKHLLEAFLFGTGIRDVGKKYETLKKKDYRQRKKVHEFLVQALQKIGVQATKKSIYDLSPGGGHSS